LITLTGDVKKGILSLTDKIEFEEKDVETEYVVSPSFFNAHVHLGDSHIKDPPFIELEKLVGPGGFKFQMMSKGGVEAIKDSIEIALSSGTTILADFREGGVEGINILKKADKNRVCFPFARPSDVEEAKLLAEDEYVKGFGMSSTRDHEIEFLEEIRKIAKCSGKLFGIHAGERDAEDVDGAINLNPDFIVHMNMAEKSQIKRVMEENIPVVSCIRSNAFFGLLNLENYGILADYEKWLIGTDNVMVASPSILAELKFAAYLLRRDVEIFMSALRGFELFDSKPSLVIYSKNKNLSCSLNSFASIVRRAEKDDIINIIDMNDLKNIFDY